MSLVTIAVLRAHLETDLGDEALQRVIDDAESEINELAGLLGTSVDEVQGATLSTALFLSRRATEISTIIEEIRSGTEYVSTLLDPADYKLRYEGRQVERLASGPNPRYTWGDVVTIVSVPKDDTDRRIRVTIDLCKLAAQYSGLDSEKVGDYQSQMKRYTAERNEVLSQLSGWGFA